MACRRYELDPKSKINEEAILKVLRRSKLEIRTKVVTMTVRSSWHMYGKLEKTMSAMRGRDHNLHVIQGTAGVTLIMDGAVAKEIRDGRDACVGLRAVEIANARLEVSRERGRSEHRPPLSVRAARGQIEDRRRGRRSSR